MTPIPKQVKREMEADKNSVTFTISRAPTPTFNSFIALANKEFCGDYGMTLKWLMEQTFDNRFADVLRILKDHEDKLNVIMNGPIKEEEPKGPKLVNGKVIGRCEK